MNRTVLARIAQPKRVHRGARMLHTMNRTVLARITEVGGGLSAPKRPSATAVAALGGFGLGVAVTSALNGPWRRRRLSLLRDQIVHATHGARRAASKTMEDARNRAQGVRAGLAARFGRVAVDDATLEERVRARLGRVSRHPGAIETWAHGGAVTLSGAILADEVERVVRAARSVPGVKQVVNELEVYDQPGHIPSLQGEHPARDQAFEYLQENWSPAARFLAAAVGGGLGLYGVGRRGVVGATAATAGLGLLLRALTNLPLRRLVGIRAGRRAVDIAKDINIDAPVERVFEMWSRIETFPRFMVHVRAVQNLGDGRSRWTVAGPAGIPVRWEAELTSVRSNELIAWQTVRRWPVAHAGTVRFDRNPDGTTRLGIKMSYNPVAGWLGHLLVTLLGANPKRAIDEDLARFKSLLEQGKTTAHGEEVTVDDLVPVQAS